MVVRVCFFFSYIPCLKQTDIYKRHHWPAITVDQSKDYREMVCEGDEIVCTGESLVKRKKRVFVCSSVVWCVQKT